MKIFAMVLAIGLSALLLVYIGSSIVSIVNAIAAKKRAKAARNIDRKESNS